MWPFALQTALAAGEVTVPFGHEDTMNKGLYASLMASAGGHMRLFAAAVLTAGFSVAQTPTFSRDVAPILEKHCQECHRAGEIGPMPLLSFNDARPWAKSI